MKTQKVNCYSKIRDLIDFKGDILLPPNETFVLKIDYPLENSAGFSIRTGETGMGFAGLLYQIGKAYKTIYEDPNKFGIWGHDIGDLVLEAVTVDMDNKTIKVSVGS